METQNKNPHSPLICAYREHLQTVCGATSGTCELFTWHLSKFLAVKYGKQKPDLKSLKAQDFMRYISDLSKRYKANTRKSSVSTLRSFLRWLQMNGQCDQDLINAVPTVSARRLSDVPVHLSESQLAILLDSFERSKPCDMRGYAAALCMARLGLRVGEVAQLTLDDIDWQAGTLHISKAKGRRANIVPLTYEVGKAIVEYLQLGRPSIDHSYVFCMHYPPEGRPVNKGTLRADISRAFKRSRLDVPSKGTRVFRHTAATHLIRSGATIKEIADILGHRSIDTTGIYAKVDIPSLQKVAIPWPEVTS